MTQTQKIYILLGVNECDTNAYVQFEKNQISIIKILVKMFHSLARKKSPGFNHFIDEEFEIPEGSRTRILYDGLVGENYIGILPNPVAEQMMRHGDFIPGSSASDLANFIDIGSQSLIHAEAILRSLRK